MYFTLQRALSTALGGLLDPFHIHLLPLALRRRGASDGQLHGRTAAKVNPQVVVAAEKLPGCL